MISAREAAFNIVLQFEQEKARLDILLAGGLTDFKADPRSRRFARNLSSGVIRHLLYLDWIARQLYRGKFKKMLGKTKSLLRLALYEIIFMDAVPARASLNEYVNLAKKKLGFKTSQMVNGILRSYLRQKEELQPGKIIADPLERISVLYSFPLWMVQRWEKYWGLEETERLCRAINEPPRFDLQINTLAISVRDFKNMLDRNEITFRESRYFDNMVTVEDFHEIIAHGWLEQGFCSVQDESAAIPVHVLNPQNTDLVLDICAAPGGKYLQLLQNKPQMAVAADIDLQRLKRVKENVTRLKLPGGYFVCADGRNLPFKTRFTKILLDAPCSGLGVIRKHPDIKWRRQPEEPASFSILQQEILQSAATLLKVGGQMTYSTCTIDETENEDTVNAFLKNDSNGISINQPAEKFKPFEQGRFLRTFPQHHNTDGSFCVLFQKK